MADQIMSISSGLGILKNYYQGPIRDQFSEEIPVFRGAEKVKQGWSGLQVNMPLRLNRNQGIGAVSDGGVLPTIGQQGTAQAIIPAKFNYLRFGVTGPMIKSSASDVGSFVRAAAFQLEYGYKDLRSDVNRQAGWNGNGIMALVNTAAVASTTLVIKGRESTEPALKFIDSGFTFDVVNSAGTEVIASNISVVSISGTPTAATATLTLSQPVTLSANDRLIRAGSFGNELQGLLTALDGGTSTIFSIDRSVFTQYQGNVQDVGGAQLSLNDMQLAYNQAMQRGGGVISAIYCDFTSLAMYQKLLTADKRYVNTVQGDGGFAKKDKFYMDFNGSALVPDKDAPTRFFFLDETALKLFVLAEMEFADETGSMYIAQVSQDAYEVRIRYFANLFNQQPSACAVVTNYISP